MNHRRQRGMTLVELLVAMAVTSVVLVGLTGVLYTVNNRYQQWADRVNTASVGTSLAAALEADSGHFGVCQRTISAPELDFCLPNGSTSSLLSTMTVQYKVSAAKPYVISREQLQPVGGHAGYIARSQGDLQPLFTVECQTGAGVISGRIHVDNLRAGGSAGSISVSYHAPLQSCP